MTKIVAFWQRGLIGKIVLSIAGLFAALIVCCVAIFLIPTPARNVATTAVPVAVMSSSPTEGISVASAPTVAPPTATRIVLATLATDVPTAELPAATSVPAPTAKPVIVQATKAPAPTAVPVVAKPTVAPAAPAATPVPAPAAQGDSYPCKSGQFKGNRNSNIYHSPGQRDYAKTQANVQCFDTAAQAEAAGYHAAKR